MKNVINVLLFVALVIVSAGVAYWLSNGRQLVFESPDQQILPKLEEKSFEEVLNHFLKEIDTHAGAYRKLRKVPADLVKPENLKTAQYIDENSTLFNDTVTKQRAEMQGVMDAFSTTDEKINLLMVGKPQDQVDQTRAQWQELKDKQMASYVDFFSYEEDMIDAYTQLLDLYKANAATLHYDEASKQTVFDDPAAKVQEQDLREKLKTLAKDQFALVKKDGMDMAKPEDLTSQPTISPAAVLNAQPTPETAQPAATAN